MDSFVTGSQASVWFSQSSRPHFGTAHMQVYLLGAAI